MPELPEVETVRRGLAPVLEGARLAEVIVRRAGLRIPFPDGFAGRLCDRTVVAARRRAKYLLLDLDDGQTLLIHLGMSGRMLVERAQHPFRSETPHDHVVFATAAGDRITFNDPRRFGLMTLAATAELENHRLLAGIGPEPLGNRFDPDYLSVALAGRRTSVKAALLDQAVVAGIGNIYASEALFEARISPRRLAATIPGRRAERLVAAVRSVLTRAIDAGGSSLRDYVQSNGELGYFQHAFAVYDRESGRCPNCDCDPQVTGGIRRIVQSNRSTFYCPRVQR